MRTVLLLWGMRARRDAVQVSIWIIGNAAMALLSVVGVRESYGTAADRTGLLATAIANPVILLFRGLPSGAEPDAFSAFLIVPFLVMLAAFMGSFLAVRHTRAEEESGRAELIGATTAGRTAPLAATVLHALSAEVVMGAFIAAAFLSTGAPVLGSVMCGAATGLAGLAFFALTLVAAQLMPTSRSANTVGVSLILVAFALSGIGNAIGTPNAALTRMESAWPTWLSIFGWAENTRPFADDNAAPLLLCAAVAVTFTAVAVVWALNRDLGAAAVAERRGPAAASAALRGPTSLVGRLTWGGILAWAIGGVLTGLLATGLASVVGQVTTQVPAVAQILKAMSAQGDLTEGTVIIFFTLVGVLAGCATIQVVARARQEEAHGTVEPIWSAAVGRTRWLGGYVLLGVVAIVAVIAGAIVGAALGLAGTGGSPDIMRAVWISAGGQAIAAAVFLGVTALLVVVLPRLAVPLAWTIIALATIGGLFGPLFQLPDAVVHLSPIGAAPSATTDGIAANGIVWISIAAVLFTALALILVRRRPLVAAG